MTLRGIDVSSFQGVIDWSKARTGLTFAIARCVTETGSIDTQFEANLKAIRAAGLIGGAYCFLTEGHGGAQGAAFVAEIKRVGGDRGIMFILDVERGAGVVPNLSDIAGFVNVVRGAFPMHPIMLYGSPGVLSPIGTLGAFGTWWEAAWPTATAGAWDTVYAAAGGDNAAAWGKDACGWTHADLWQFSSNGVVPGIAGRVDLDATKHTLPYLQSLAAMVRTDADITAATTSADDLAAAKLAGEQEEWDREFGTNGGAKIAPLARPS